MAKINGSTRFSESLLSELRALTNDKSLATKALKPESEDPKGASFQDYLIKSIKETNQVQKDADVSATNLSTGASQNIHETMLKTAEAELTLNLLVQVRNKALAAYQEIMRMPV